MARKARIEFAGAVYHVLDRGDRREEIFRTDADRELFLKTLGEVCGRTGWRVHAWVLMGNHYHLLIETPQANLVAGMRWFQTTYTVRFNRRHRLSGHLFQGRYKAVVVDPEERGYFATLSDYIHLNPVRAKLVGLDGRLFDYRWSSYRWFAATSGRTPWFTPDWVLSELGLRDDAAGRRAYAERMRRRAVEELADLGESPTRKELRRGWCLGGPAFRERMLTLLDTVGEKLKGHKEIDGSVRRSHGEDEASRLFAAGLAALGLSEAELAGLAKGDARKLALAAFIRERTAVPNAWLARALHAGHASRVSRACSKPINESWRRKLESKCR
jgi:REP element-mobilizing transposase RayT